MRMGAYLLTIMMGLLLTMPIAAQEEKKPGQGEEPKGKTTKKVDGPKDNVLPWKRLPSFVGRVKAMSGGKYTIEVKQKVKVPVRDAASRALRYKADYARFQRDYASQIAKRRYDLARQFAQVQRERDPRRRAQLYAQYQRTLATPQRPPQPPRPPVLYEMKDISNDIDVRPSKDVIIRNVKLGALEEDLYDEKGQLKTITPALLKKLRGPEGYPGYPATAKDVGTNLYVKLYLTPVKRTKKGKKGSANIADILGGEKNGEDEVDGPVLPEVRMVVILSTGGRR